MNAGPSMRKRPFQPIAKVVSVSSMWIGSGSPSPASRAASWSEGSSSHAIARFAREQDELTDTDHASGVVGCPTLNVADFIGETKALAVHHALARSTLDAGVCHGTFHQIIRRLAAVRLPLLRPHCHSRLPQWAVAARTGGALFPKRRWHSCAQQRDLEPANGRLPELGRGLRPQS